MSTYNLLFEQKYEKYYSLEVKFSIYLNRRAFVMHNTYTDILKGYHFKTLSKVMGYILTLTRRSEIILSFPPNFESF